MGFLTSSEKQHRSKLARSTLINALLILLIVCCLILAFLFLIRSDKDAESLAAEKLLRDRAVATKMLKADQEGDSETFARLYQELKASDPQANDLRHLLYVSALKLKETEYAEELEKELAPGNGSGGYPLTHYAVALAISKKKGMTRNDFLQMNRHLVAAVRSPQVPEDAYRLLGDGLFAVGNFKSALDAYKKVKERTADLQYKIALALLRAGNELAAREELEQAVEMYRAACEKDPNDIRSLILWTKALFLAGRTDEAERVLIEKLESDDDLAVRNELIQHYLAQLQMTGNVIRRKEMLKRICDLDPTMRINPATREAFFTLGNYLVRENRFEEAKAYYEICAERIQFPPEVKNNLAWVETRLPDGDLQKALKLANEAIADSGKTSTGVRPEYYGTRGQIEARLGQWKAAREDLEKALPEVREKHEIQLALAVTYTRLGDREHGEKMFRAAKYREVDTLDELLKKYPE